MQEQQNRWTWQQEWEQAGKEPKFLMAFHLGCHHKCHSHLGWVSLLQIIRLRQSPPNQTHILVYCRASQVDKQGYLSQVVSHADRGPHCKVFLHMLSRIHTRDLIAKGHACFDCYKWWPRSPRKCIPLFNQCSPRRTNDQSLYNFSCVYFFLIVIDSMIVMKYVCRICIWAM